jgi:bifunctional non-homologous end joining protein LigD
MLPSPASPFHRPGWIYEEKYDGWRCLAYKRDGLVRLLSRQGVDYTGHFRALAAAVASLPAATLLLDGEVTAFDERLLSRRPFWRPDHRVLVTPPIYLVFDCVHARGRDLRDHPLGARREVLERLLDDQSLLFPARRLPAHGLAAWAEVQRCGYEGLVAKDESSAYRSGRTRAWLKVKRRNGDGAGRDDPGAQRLVDVAHPSREKFRTQRVVER